MDVQIRNRNICAVKSKGLITDTSMLYPLIFFQTRTFNQWLRYMYYVLCFVIKFEASVNLSPILRSKCVISLDGNIVNPQMYCQYWQELCIAERIGRRESLVWISKFYVNEAVQLWNWQINGARPCNVWFFIWSV